MAIQISLLLLLSSLWLWLLYKHSPYLDGLSGSWYNNSLQVLCPFFSMMEALPAITLSIALLLAFTKAIVLLATFVVKRYVNNRNILIALFIIVCSKVSGTVVYWHFLWSFVEIGRPLINDSMTIFQIVLWIINVLLFMHSGPSIYRVWNKVQFSPGSPIMISMKSINIQWSIYPLEYIYRSVFRSFCLGFQFEHNPGFDFLPDL